MSLLTEVLKPNDNAFSGTYTSATKGSGDDEVVCNLSLVENPILLTYSSEVIPAAANVLPLAQLKVNATGTGANKYFYLKGIKLTTSTNPGSRQFLSYPTTGATDTQASMESLAETINADPYLSQFYKAVATLAGVWSCYIYAKYYGQPFWIDLDFCTNIVALDNPTGRYTANPDAPVDIDNVAADQRGDVEIRGIKLQRYDYAVYVRLFVFNKLFALAGSPDTLADDYERIASLVRVFQKDNLYSFDVAPFLKSYVRLPMLADLSTLHSTAVVLYEPAEAIKAFAIEYGEEFTGGKDIATDLPIEFEPFNVSLINTNKRKYKVDYQSTFWAIVGSEDTLKPNKLNEFWDSSPDGIHTYILPYQNAPHSKPTILPNDTISTQSGFNEPYSVTGLRMKQVARPISPLAHERNVELLWFIWLRGTNEDMDNLIYKEDLYWRVSGQKEDATPFTSTPALLKADVTNGLKAMRCDYHSLGLSAFESSTHSVLWYEVEILAVANGTGEDEEDAFLPLTSQKYWLKNNTDKPQFNRHCIFRSGKGVWETFTFTGITEAVSTVQPTNFNRGYQPDKETGTFDRSQFLDSVYQNAVNKTFTTQSGWVDKAHYDWLLELVCSPEIYFWIQDSKSTEPDGNNYWKKEVDYVLKAGIIKKHKWQQDSENNLFNLEISFEFSENPNTVTHY